MRIKVIKTHQEHERALDMLDRLMVADPQPGTAEYEKMELLAALISKYEDQVFPEIIPDPIDALIFRMEQLDLNQADLVPYIGSKSKVSEVLSKKRPLSLNMIKALHKGLGIPAEVLLSQKRKKLIRNKVELGNFPVREMINRGHLSQRAAESKEDLKAELRTLLETLNGENVFALLRRTSYIRSQKPMSHDALLAWTAVVVGKAKSFQDLSDFYEENLNKEFLREIVDMSNEIDAIPKAISYIQSKGIAVVIEPHFPKTYLDGAAIMMPEMNPIVGLTVRHDRLDNFWFTLLHELAHIHLHRNKGKDIIFFDETMGSEYHDAREEEADKVALEAMVPKRVWEESPASILPSKAAAQSLAKKLDVHPSIVAGKMRYQNNYFKHLVNLVGYGEVRKIFPEVVWK